MLRTTASSLAFFYPLMNGNTLQVLRTAPRKANCRAPSAASFDVAERITPTASLLSRKGKEQIWLFKKCS